MTRNGAFVALPKLELCKREHWEEWCRLDDDEFFEKHGAAILAEYELPTDEQAEQFEAMGFTVAVDDADVDA